MALQRVWEPVRIGDLEIRNRIARAANTTTMFPTPIDDQFVAYHEARASGGVGLTILEAGSVHPSSQIAYMVDKASAPGYEKLMAAARPHGMRVFQQLWHGGHNLGGKAGQIPWGPSATPSPLTGIVSEAMTGDQIAELVAAFAQAARLCREVGLDGVELHGGHGYVVQQFLSPLTNLRDDAYNGDIAARARFAIEVLTAIREACGPDFPLGIRLSASTADGGTNAADLAWLAAHLEAKGLIDFVDLSFSDYFRMSAMASTMAVPTGYQLAHNAPIAQAVRAVPRIVTGRYRTLEEAEQVLREGEADLVSLVRAQIADPMLVAKTAQGRLDDVRPCIACNQGCVGGLLTIGRMQCTVNPAAGYESELDERRIERVATPLRVLVVGGGPAGLEAARVAALAGHDVILAEAGPALGGAARVGAHAPNLATFGDYLDWAERQVYALGVDVRLSSYIEIEDVQAIRADVVLVACGASAVEDGRQTFIPGEPLSQADLARAVTPDDLIAQPPGDLAGRQAVIYDDVGRYEAIAAAELLQQAGADVTFVTSLGSFAPRMAGTSRDTESFARLSAGGRFRLVVGHNLLSASRGQVAVRAQGLVGPGEPLPSDILVLNLAKRPRRDLYDALVAADKPSAHLIGDARSPRDMLAAIHEGHRAARRLHAITRIHA